MNSFHFPLYVRSARRRGSSIVEFALIVPILIALMVGIVEIAMLSRNQLMLSNAAREGARAASLGRTTTAIKTRVTNGAKMLGLAANQVTLDYSTDDGATYGLGDSSSVNNAPAGSLVRVSVAYPHKSLTGMFPYLKDRVIRVSVSMRKETA